MVEPITATYVQENGDWTITVTGGGKRLTARAPGIIAARDRADQLVEKVEPEQAGRTVVHLLNGNALDFSATYMQARLARPAPASSATTEAGKNDTPKSAGKQRRTRPPARHSAGKNSNKNAGSGAKQDPAAGNSKHAEISSVLGGEGAPAPQKSPAEA
ncbi:MAG: hypothetical protein ACRDSE_09070 [Pseudonocardiaceae bacterium]